MCWGVRDTGEKEGGKERARERKRRGERELMKGKGRRVEDARKLREENRRKRLSM